MVLNQQLLEQRLAILGAVKTLPAAHVEKLATVLRGEDDWSCFRVNPVAFGAKHGIPPREAIDLFLHASRAGLVELRFNLICPGCGSVEHQLHSMDLVPSNSWFCVVCQRDIESALDDRVEVSFSAEIGVRDLQLRVYDSAQNYFRYYFSENVMRSPELAAITDPLMIELVTAMPDGTASFQFEAKPGLTYRLLSLDNHSQVMLPTSENGPREIEVGSTAESITPERVTIGTGKVSVRVVNRSASRIGVMLMQFEGPKVMKVASEHPNSFRPFLTAKTLLNNQTFRELYRVHSLDVNMRLRLKSLTLLFTDLKGSTELYDRTGDIRAYTFVREHFTLLGDAVRRNGGAMIKTMGDAIMASFDEPTHAARAAIEMMQGMNALNAPLKAEGHDTGLKIGLHEGPALAVNADERLDYFGQTVNVAARVQGLAAGEIWLTPSVMNAPGVSGELRTAGWASEEKDVSLKGVGGNTRVFRMHASS